MIRNRLSQFFASSGFAMLLVTTLSTPSAAITINRNFVGPGNPFPLAPGSAGAAPLNAAGGGNLNDVFHAAADWWEVALLDNHSYTINFGWAPLPGANLGIATQFNVPQPGVGGDIRFDNDGTSVYFVDPTPEDSAEYQTFTVTANDLGGGPVNDGRVYSNPTGDAVGRHDLLTIAKHEIGHLLGIATLGGGSFTTPTLSIGAPLPNAGTIINTVITNGGHIADGPHPNALMIVSAPTDIRRLTTGIDILAAAEVNGFEKVNLDPTLLTVPEPSAFLIACLSGLILCMRRRPWRRRDS